MIAHTARKSGRVKTPSCHTKSALERNFTAAASSKKAIKPLTVFSQEPDFGNLPRNCGNMASKKNGRAKAMLKPSMPTTGKSLDAAVAVAPFEPAELPSTVPTNGTVQ